MRIYMTSYTGVVMRLNYPNSEKLTRKKWIEFRKLKLDKLYLFKNNEPFNVKLPKCCRDNS